MLCQDCGKRESTVHFKQIINNQKVELNLCRQCADKRGFHNPIQGMPFPLAEFLASMVSTTSPTEKKRGRQPDPKCNFCGLSFSEFSKQGRFGCGQCYTAFRAQLTDLLRKIHGSNQHQGKFPSTKDDVMQPLREERKLQDELKKAIFAEDFEKAALIRDRLRTLTGKQQSRS